MKRSNPVSVFFCLAVSIALAVLSPSGLSAASPNHAKDTFVENFDIVVPADEGCSGEDVHIFGTLDGVIQTTTDSRGGLHISFHLVPHLSAVGLSTGLEYRAVGPLHTIDFIDGSGPRVSGLVNIINLISPGSSDNLRLTQVAHVTVNANGVTTVEFEGIKGGCRG